MVMHETFQHGLLEVASVMEKDLAFGLSCVAASS